VVCAGHAVLLIVLIAAGSLRACRETRYVTMNVGLVALPSPAPAAAPQNALDRPVQPSTPEPLPAEPAQTTSAAPVWQPRSVEDIRQTATLQPVRREPPAQTTPRQLDADAISRRLAQSVENVSVSVTPSPSQTPSRPDTAALNRYLAVVSRQLHGAWQQPAASEVSGGRPVVTVSIKVQASGAIAGTSITRTSGSAAMDNSVAQLMAHLRALPPLRDYGLRDSQLTISIAFELD
jgi:protein TonB